MNFAQIAVMDEQGYCVWEGSLLRFVKDNSMDRIEASALIGALAALNEGRPEPATIGGGAAPMFYVSLVY